MSVTRPTLRPAAGLDCFAVAVVVAIAMIATSGEQHRREALVGIQWNSSSNVDGAHATGRRYATHS